MATTDHAGRVARSIRVGGTVQGVGYRPFVWRLAVRLSLTGWVRNDRDGVLIHVEGRPERLALFRSCLRRRAPRMATVTIVVTSAAGLENPTDFRVIASEPGAGAACVPADRGVCKACRGEVAEPTDRRFGYPFTTCTACGPRYSLICTMPYDRPETGMAAFPLCSACAAEYTDPATRRFHAESIACPDCGPTVALWDESGREIAVGPDAVPAAGQLLRAGRIVAVKGLGGFQLLVRADDSAAVRRLRERKARPTKPLAVMVADLPGARRLARPNAAERRLLRSPENPIVLLRKRLDAPLAAEIAPRLNHVGLFLATTPLHALLLGELGIPVVATSGNRSDEPIATDEREIPTRLAGIADGFLVHDRPILRRVDDSVVRFAGGGPVAIRLARGYAPLPLPALERFARRVAAPAGLLAVGGQQKSAVALWTGARAILGPHVGDLHGREARAAFVRMSVDLPRLYGCPFRAVACDLHPDYFATRWAAEQGRPVLAVQHHHAHAAAVMIEHDVLDEEVLAFTWDGTGLGTDGTIWGGEVLRARLDGFERLASLRPFRLLGGEAAIQEPARVALALLANALGTEAIRADAILLGRLGLSAAAAGDLLRLVERGVNSPFTTSVGRLFDAIAALLWPVGRVSFEGEAAAWLESAADDTDQPGYPLPGGDWRPLVRAILADQARGVSEATIATRFHQALADWAAECAVQLPGLTVVLGGGCFQNRVLLERTRATLERTGRRVYHAGTIPPGDGGLAAGQLAVALAKLALDGER